VIGQDGRAMERQFISCLRAMDFLASGVKTSMPRLEKYSEIRSR
jgi:hypothetical protein